MRIALIGCGFTAYHYATQAKRYPQLELVGATDTQPQLASRFCADQSIQHYPSLDAILADRSIEMVVNLTYSRNHFEVTKACLEAGKHVYSEKPLAMDLAQARTLVELAEAKHLYLSAAPCALLGETAQTLWRALRNEEIGKIRLVYAELDDGPLHMGDPHLWRSPSGAPYEYREEFAAGVTVEHAEYYLAWFTAFFGPAKSITSFSACLWPDRQVTPDEILQLTTPDFSSACITFESGVVARLTCGLVAPFDHGMKIVGDKGVLAIDEGWNFSAPVYIDRYSKLRQRAERYAITKTYPFLKNWLAPRRRIYPPVKKSNWRKRNARHSMDYARGIAELARAIGEGRPSRLPPDHCLHVNELVLALQHPCRTPYQVTTTFKPLQPMDDDALRELLPARS